MTGLKDKTKTPTQLSLQALDRLEYLIKLKDEGQDVDESLLKSYHNLILSSNRVARNLALEARMKELEAKQRRIETEVRTLASRLHEYVTGGEHLEPPESKY